MINEKHDKSNNPPPLLYSAKQNYLSEEVAANYEKVRFSGALGRYRFNREHAAVQRILSGVCCDKSVICDVPCGVGRWWPDLSHKAGQIIGFDISPIMVSSAQKMIPKLDVPVQISVGDAENLGVEDDSVDWVFSFALMKHMPIPIQYKVLQEFSRISRKGVICTFSMFSFISYPLWRMRSNPHHKGSMLLPETLKHMAKSANLNVESILPCTTPIGVEKIVLLRKSMLTDTPPA